MFRPAKPQRSIGLRELLILGAIHRIGDQADSQGYVWLDSVIDSEEDAEGYELCIKLCKNSLLSFARQPNRHLSRKVKLTEKGIECLKENGVHE